MSESAKIRGFLLQKPKPSSVRVTGEGEPETIAVGRSYSRLAETIDALNVDLIECLDASGKVLRALRLSSSESQRAETPSLPAVLANDPHAALLTHFGSLLANAYQHSTEVAFQRLVDITEGLRSHTESLEARLAQMESQLRRAHNDLLETELDRIEELKQKVADDGGGFGEQMIQSFLGARMGGAAAPPRAKNGAG